MQLTRRTALKLLAAVPLLGSAACSTLGRREDSAAAAPTGPFLPTRESLNTYQAPDWFRDAKFGIWNHWGPQSL